MTHKNGSWLSLGPGDTVEMIAAGFPFSWTDVRATERILKSWDLRLHYPKKILAPHHPVSANSREARFEFFKSAVKSDSKVIWAARGGYGSLHLVEDLKKIKPPKRKKLFIGFSDNCTLSHYVMQEWGWAALHGPHIDRLSYLNSARLKEMKKIIFGERRELDFKGLKPMNGAARKKRLIRASVTGGNLVTAQSTLGTRWQMDTAGKILFFEEIGERGYRIDRILEHMRLMGVFSRARAVIFGPFVGGAEPDGAEKVPKVLAEFAGRCELPVFRGVNSGHVANSLAIPLGTAAELATGPQGGLTVSTGCRP